MITDSPAAEAPGLDEYLRMLWRRKLIIALFLIAGIVLATMYANSITPKYTAESRMVLGPMPTEGPFQDANLEREADNVQSDANTRAVIDKLQLGSTVKDVQKELKIQFTPDSDVLRITFTDTDPKRAADVANAFAQFYVTNREEGATKFYTDAIAIATQELASIDKELTQKSTEIAAIDERVNILNRELVRFPLGNPEIQGQLAALANNRLALTNDVAILQGRRGAVSADLSELAKLSRTRPKSADVTRSAREPTAPNGLGTNMIKALGVLGGLTLGAIAAFVLDRFDKTTKGEREVETLLGAPVLASVPGFPGNAANGLIMLRNTTGKKAAAARDSYRRLRSTVDFLAKRNDIKSFLITSSRPGEGKSVTATNLAIASAQTGRKVALVSGDLHRPTIERMLSLPEHAGVSEFLLDESEAILSEVPDIPNLTVVTTGRQVDNPAELLASHRVAELIKHLEELNDIVIIDTPPVLNAADALALANRVDGVLIVADRRADGNDLGQLRDEMDLVGANVIGAVLNRSRIARKRDSYAYTYTARRA